MSNDKEPLLLKSQSSFDDEGYEKLSIKTLFNYRQWFRRQKYVHAGDDDENETVNVLQMFRFADRIDIFLMILTMFFLIMETCLFVTGIVLFSRLTGIFAMESFANTCRQQENSIEIIKNNITCPLNFNHLHKLCTTSLPSVTSSFRENVMMMIYWLFVISIGQFVSVTFGTWIWMITIRRQTSRINIELFRSLLQRNISFFDTNSASQTNAKLFSSIDTIQLGIGLDFKVLSGALCYIAASLLTAFVVNWKLTLIVLCIVPFIFAGSILFSKIMARETMNELNAQSKVGQIVEEVFSSIRTVLSFNGGTYEQKRYEKELSHTRQSTVRKGAVYGIYVGWLYFVSFIIYSIGFIFGSILISYEDQNSTDISDVLVIVSLFALCTDFLARIGTFYQALAEGQAAATSVFRAIDEANIAEINEEDIWKENNRSSSEWMSDINGDIKFDDVSFIYPTRKDVPVLRHLSFIARAGQITALVGSSGCGKSTCVSLLLRQYDSSSGQIILNGRSINDYNLKQLRQNIGVVSQEPILFNMSIYENIRYGKVNATRTEIEEAARQANAHDFIMHLPNKYETLVGERGIQLSGGEKQRIALARALVKQPSILLLDEATSALDNISEKIVQEALDQACRNRTTIVIAHRLTTIQNADYIYVLDNGYVCEEGTHYTLMTRHDGKYQAIVKKQQIETINKIEDNEMDEQSILSRSRLMSDSELFGANKESATSSTQKHIFLRLLSMSKPERMLISIGCIISVMNGIFQVINVILLARIVSAFDYCASSQIRRQVLFLCGLFLLCGMLMLVLRFLEYTIFALTGSKLIERIRIKTFSCLLRQETAYFDRPENSSGAISLRLSSDAAAFEQMVGTRLGVICETVALTISGFLFGIFYSWQLTIIVSLTFLILLVNTYLNIRFSRTLSKQSNDILQNANTFAVEFIHNMRTIKQLSVEKYILEGYAKSIDQAHRMFRKLDLATCIFFGIWYSCDPLSMAILFWSALILCEKNQLEFDNIIMIFSFAIFATQSLTIVGMLATRIGQSLSAAQRFFDLFDRTPTIDNASTQGQQLIHFRGEIEFDQVKFIYPSRPTSVVLNRFQLTVKSGQRIALVGASGCGKSTIVQLLERFYDATKGRILFDGVDIRRLNIQWLRSRLGLVSQEPVLFDLTIAENISYGLENVSMEKIVNAASKANIADFIYQLPMGYETRVGVKGCLLSGGEKQRIAIARVLLRQPKILLLDEATSALDLYNEQIVQAALEQAQTEDASRTSLIIAHRLSTIRSCDMICVLDGGRLVERGTHTELMERRGIYYTMLAQHSA